MSPIMAIIFLVLIPAVVAIIWNNSKVRLTPALLLKGFLYWLGVGLLLFILIFFIPEWLGKGLDSHEARMFGVFIVLDALVWLSILQLARRTRRRL